MSTRISPVYFPIPHKEPVDDREEESTNDVSFRSLAMTQIPIHGMDDYYKGDDINATLTIKYKDHTIISILDGGAKITIIIKKCKEEWGSPLLEKTNLHVKMANG